MNSRFTANEYISIIGIFLTEIISRKKDYRGNFSILYDVESLKHSNKISGFILGLWWCEQIIISLVFEAFVAIFAGLVLKIAASSKHYFIWMYQQR